MLTFSEFNHSLKGRRVRVSLPEAQREPVEGTFLKAEEDGDGVAVRLRGGAAVAVRCPRPLYNLALGEYTVAPADGGFLEAEWPVMTIKPLKR